MDRRRFLLRAAGTAAAFGVLRGTAACRPGAPTPAAAGDPGFGALRERYFVRALWLNPVTSTYLGGDGYAAALADVNGTLRDVRPDAIADEVAFYKEIDRARRNIDPARLAPADRIDHAVLGAQLAFL